MSKITPLPWKVLEGMIVEDCPKNQTRMVCSTGVECYIYSDHLVNHAHMKANARLIVRSVNNHEALVNALKNLMPVAEIDSIYAMYRDKFNQAEVALTYARGVIRGKES